MQPQSNTHNRICDQCGKVFYVPYPASKPRKFCSRSCAYKFKTGKPLGGRDAAAVFWRKAHTGPVESCWEFPYSVSRNGYGRATIYGRFMSAHRAAWILAHGEIPDGLWVLHRCDNKLCVNPAHLFLGTAADNVKDMIQKGRKNIQPSENASRGKLTRVQVEEIRRQYVPKKWGKHSGVGLAKQYGVATSTIYEILHNKHWRF